MSVRNRFRRIHRIVQKFLQERQFLSRGQTFWRPTEQLSQVVILRRSIWNTAETCDFWFELGVHVPGFTPLLDGIPEPAYPKEQFLVVSLRVDSVPSRPVQQQTLSWYLKADDPLPQADEQVITEVLYELREYGVPFLSRFASLADVIEFLEWLRLHREECFRWGQIMPFEAWTPVYLAILHWLNGDVERCFQELEKALSGEELTAYIYDKVSKVKERLLVLSGGLSGGGLGQDC